MTSACRVTLCDSPIKTRSMCGKHYKRWMKHGDVNKGEKRVNGSITHKAYGSWSAMKQRCLNPNSYKYPLYGARGIQICDRWTGDDGFNNFLKDMGERPDGMSLDRIDNDGNYEPNNCRWATAKEQANNRRMRRLVVHQPTINYHSTLRKWQVRLTQDRTRKTLGYFKSLVDAQHFVRGLGK